MGKDYELERLDISEGSKTFRIKDAGGYNGQPALMRVVIGERVGKALEAKLKKVGELHRAFDMQQLI